jgi:hypothetical protein
MAGSLQASLAFTDIKPLYYHSFGCQLCNAPVRDIEGNMYEIPIKSIYRGSLYCCIKCIPNIKQLRDKINNTNLIENYFNSHAKQLQNITFCIRRSDGTIESDWKLSTCPFIIWMNNTKHIECVNNDLICLCNLDEILEVNLFNN